MTYADGFHMGERYSFKDRRHGRVDGLRVMANAGFTQALAEYWRGFRDGYTPRSAVWALELEAAHGL